MAISYAYQWRRCDSAGNNCANITDGVLQTYVPGSADVGAKLRVRVTASNASGQTTADSAATDVVTDPPPLDVPDPSGANEQYGTSAWFTSAIGSESADRSRLMRITLPKAGYIRRVYMAHVAHAESGSQVSKAVAYAGDGTAGPGGITTPGTLKETSAELTLTGPYGDVWSVYTFAGDVEVGPGDVFVGDITGATGGFGYIPVESAAQADAFVGRSDVYDGGAETSFGSPTYNVTRFNVVVEIEPTSVQSDTTKPTVSGATVDGLSIVWTFSEALNPANVPAVSELTIKADAVVQTIQSGTPTVDGQQVRFSLSAPVAEGATVTCSYSGTSLRDLAGNQADTFTDQAVTNSTVARPRSEVANRPRAPVFPAPGAITSRILETDITTLRPRLTQEQLATLRPRT